MNATSLIKRHISRLRRGALFTTRDMLIYGTRTAVDQALAKLVKQEFIVRLARGVFVREGSDIKQISARDVAVVKATSFGRRIADWPGDLLRRLGIRANDSNATCFSVDSGSSSFKFGHLTIHFRKTCPRKMHLAGSRAGQYMVALWHAGREVLEEFGANPSFLPGIGRADREVIRTSLNWTPHWLNAFFLNWRLPPGALRC